MTRPLAHLRGPIRALFTDVDGTLTTDGRIEASTYAALEKLGEAGVPVILQARSSEPDIRGLVIAIRPTGFIPAEIDLKEGRYLLIVQNRSGIRDLTFRLDRDTGEKLQETRDQKLQWKKTFDLHPGRYVLSVVDHPKWQSIITVKSR